jgi:chromosome segregation ATPase
MTSAEYQQLVESLDRQSTELSRQSTEIGRQSTELSRQSTELGRQSTELNRQSTEIGRRFTEMDRRFDEADLRVTELRQDMLGHFDAIYHRFERLEQEGHAITQALRRIEAGLADERGRREILERAVAELKQHVTVLQSRIEEIEQRLGR